jgi:hypothetical protein
MGQLKALGKPREMNEDDSQEYPLSDLATGDDISSLTKNGQKRVMSCSDAIEAPMGLISDEYFNLESWGRLDCKNAVFRPACLIESVFQCLYITKDNIGDLYSSIPTRYSPKKLAKDANKVLEINCVLISEHVLSKIEENWTYKARPLRSIELSNDKLFATIVYHTTISENWELRRFISCLVFDEDALNLFRIKSGLKTKHPALRNARQFSAQNAEDLLKDLQGRSIQYNLAAAISSTRQHLRTVAGTFSSNLCPNFEFVDAARHIGEPLVERDVISKVYEGQNSCPSEPADSYLRSSLRRDAVTQSSGEATVSSYFPGSMSFNDGNFALVALKTHPRSHSSYNYELCLFNVTDQTDPPSRQNLAVALEDICTKDGFYLAIPTIFNRRDNVYSELKTADSKLWNAAQAWRHELQHYLPIGSHFKAETHAEEFMEDRVNVQQVFDSKQVLPSDQSAKPYSSSGGTTGQADIQLQDSDPPEHSTFELGEDEAAELEAALAESVFTRYQELVAQASLNASPATGATATDLMAIENMKVEDNTVYNEDMTSVSPLPSQTPSNLPPSPIDNAFSALPTDSTAPSPPPEIDARNTHDSLKRPLTSEDDESVSRVGKKRKLFRVPTGTAVIVIDE